MSIFEGMRLRASQLSRHRCWRTRFLAIAAMLAGAVVMSGCGGSSGGDGGTPPVVLKPADDAVRQPASYVTLTIVDAQTGRAIEAETTVTLNGPDVAQAITPLGAAVTQLKTSIGFTSFALKATATPSTSAPLVIQLGVVSKGYLSSGAVLTISAAGATDATVRLVKTSFDAAGALTNAPAGVTGRQVTVVASADGGLASNSPDGSFTLAIPASTSSIMVTNSAGQQESVAAPSASISIPAGVKVGRLVSNTSSTSTFVPASAGPITTRVIAFTPQSQAALSSFPGGFAVMPSAGGGITAPSVFQTAGFAAYEFTDAAGNPVDRFTGPVSMTTEAPATTVTPAGAPLAIGSVLPVWSYNASIGEWKSEGSATVTAKATNGNWIVSFQSTHLSSWNLDYYGESCTAILDIQGRNGDRRYLTYLLTAEGGKYWAQWLPESADDRITLGRAPADMRITITAYDSTMQAMTQVGKITNVALCGDAPVNLPVTLSPLPPPRVINISTREVCADGSNDRALSTWAYVEHTITWDSYYYMYTDSQGIATRNVYRTGPLRFWIYNPRTGELLERNLPASGYGTTQTLTTTTFTMNCNEEPRPTGATGGTGGSGGTNGGSGSTS